MTACLILAAGQGTRLRPLTDHCPKGLVPLLGRPLIAWQLEVLQRAEIAPIAFATGFQAARIAELGHPTYHNPNFERTNMVESLMAARPFIEHMLENGAQSDLLISYADIVYEQRNLAQVLRTQGEVVVMVDEGWHALWSARNEDPLADAETMRLDAQDNIIELGQKPQTLADIEGQFTGLIKIAHHKLGALLAFYDALDRTALYDGRHFDQMYMTRLIQGLIDANWEVKAARVQHGWLEVDTLADRALYEARAQAGTLAELWEPPTAEQQQ